jgi:hypothetical protein
VLAPGALGAAVQAAKAMAPPALAAVSHAFDFETSLDTAPGLEDVIPLIVPVRFRTAGTELVRAIKTTASGPLLQSGRRSYRRPNGSECG